MFNSGSPSLADIAAVTDGNNRNNGGFGMDGGWWAIIVLLALFGGFGGNWGNNRGGNSGCGETVVIAPPMGYGYSGGMGFAEAAVQRGFDNQAVVSKLDGLNAGVCSLGYDQLIQMNNLERAGSNNTFAILNGQRDGQIAMMQGFNAMERQVADCCCENKMLNMETRFQMQQDTCDLKSAIYNSTRDITENDNANFRQLNETVRNGFNTLILNQKDQYIAELERKLNACDRDSALQGTASYIINSVRPAAVPAYPAANPNGMGNWSQNVLQGYGNSNCGCGNNCC